jgi:hypothetical protein
MQPESVRYPIFVCEQRTPHGNWRELCHSVCSTASLAHSLHSRDCGPYPHRTLFVAEPLGLARLCHSTLAHSRYSGL